ncbi:DoxX family protein [Nocardiopsis sp. MG754419]|uniref:DoxX family protein n=1 Tax=Nocardiopsis sp. MG754419 TaxID=2259865 RepID=UPI001BA749AF|nr:DoxX family protein [Nocardiopsis sp. MG754419]MBR8743127.1 DoxX family protein [Nocardiopsis sp. MG754419]
MTEQTSRVGISDVTTLLARVVVGVVFIAHGLPKATDLQGTAAGFESMGIPLPQVAALVGALIEVGAGAALLVGFALPVAGVLLALMMGGAYTFAHLDDPLVGGFEIVLVLGATALALGFSGGRLAVDRVMPWGRVRSREKASVPAA